MDPFFLSTPKKVNAIPVYPRRLRYQLSSSGWQVLNDSPVGVVVFVDERGTLDLSSLIAGVQTEQKVWISGAKFEGRQVVRACVTSFRCDPENVEPLIDALGRARAALS